MTIISKKSFGKNDLIWLGSTKPKANTKQFAKDNQEFQTLLEEKKSSIQFSSDWRTLLKRNDNYKLSPNIIRVFFMSKM